MYDISVRFKFIFRCKNSNSYEIRLLVNKNSAWEIEVYMFNQNKFNDIKREDLTSRSRNKVAIHKSSLSHEDL